MALRFIINRVWELDVLEVELYFACAWVDCSKDRVRVGYELERADVDPNLGHGGNGGRGVHCNGRVDPGCRECAGDVRPTG